jgi:hypothetical protein
MVGKTISLLPLVTSSSSSGARRRFPLYYLHLLSNLGHRWRIALMEEGIKTIDFETVDQMIQVHGTDFPSKR